MDTTAAIVRSEGLPQGFVDWFDSRGWRARPHQLQMLELARAKRNALLIAPTGGGKTLAGFLPSLVDLAENPRGGLHTLYISPLKALTYDIARNLEAPVSEMGLDLTLETRTGDTPQSKRARQRHTPPNILMTTPEQLALMLASRDTLKIFERLHTLIVDELHAFADSKRGDLLALGLARLAAIAPDHRRVGLSATVADPERLSRFIGLAGTEAAIVRGAPGPKPQVDILRAEGRIPWSGHSARHAIPELYDTIRRSKIVLIFVNTRSQAEIIFQELWRVNDDALPIALHHGSLDVERRRKVETAMAKGGLRAVVCTSTLDLGIDWGDVDLVVQIGAPKGAARTMQRIGRANHRLDDPSRAMFAPANRFEEMECLAALEALDLGEVDGPLRRSGGLDVLAQHVLGIACGAPFDADEVYQEVARTEPYGDLDRETFDRVVDFVATGGYALKRYERYNRMKRTVEGRWRVANPKIAQQYRLNVGTIVEAPMLKVRLRGGRQLGEVEEFFIEQLSPGDTFIFAGEVLRFQSVQETTAYVVRAPGEEASVPSYMGGKFPLSTFLAAKVRRILAEPEKHPGLSDQTREWLRIQKWRSILPKPDELLVEIFPRGSKFYMVAYPFEGRLAHQTLGMLLTRRMERAGLRPLGFVASDYAMAVWSLRPVKDVDGLFHRDMLGDDLEDWLDQSILMKRTFRNVATIAGLIERRFPGQEKSGRQMTISSDLIYDVLREHEPDHVLLQATWADAATGLLDVRRLADMLVRVAGHITVKRLDRVSPLAVPVMLEIGKEPVYGAAMEDLVAEVADDLIAEATSLL
ncbi:MAG: ligase-associated DNA damage response DEXH box helicase [Minwuia sp.]|uniref:ligase-associated DNA damage response DEXH box helicase n=1 Tax=Minwuia sp. TaxID=2493630 RepID=UPI003A888478